MREEGSSHSLRRILESHHVLTCCIQLRKPYKKTKKKIISSHSFTRLKYELRPHIFNIPMKLIIDWPFPILRFLQSILHDIKTKTKTNQKTLQETLSAKESVLVTKNSRKINQKAAPHLQATANALAPIVAVEIGSSIRWCNS